MLKSKSADISSPDAHCSQYHFHVFAKEKFSGYVHVNISGASDPSKNYRGQKSNQYHNTSPQSKNDTHCTL